MDAITQCFLLCPGMGSVSLLLGAERENNPLFWEVMGGKGEVAPAEEAMTDKEVAEEMAESVFLYKYVYSPSLRLQRTRVRGLIRRPLRTLRARRVMEVDGDMQAIPITETPFVREMLESNFTYILDCETEIFIWVGKKSDWESKASGIMLADVRLLYCLRSRDARVAICTNPGATTQRQRRTSSPCSNGLRGLR
jgi:hypothetical protein